MARVPEAALPGVSVSTVVFDGYGMERGFDILAELGVRAVEPAFIQGYVAFDETAFSPAGAARMDHALRQAGLAAAALSAHIDLGEADSATRLLARADFAARIGAPIVITNATTTDRRRALDQTLAAVLPGFAARQLTLALENPGHGRDALIADGQSGAALVQAIGHPALKLNYDIGNALSYGARRGSAVEDLAAALPATAHLHLKDIAETRPDWTFCAIGEGIVGYSALLAHLASAGPLPPVGLELPLRLHRPAQGDPQRWPEPVPLPVLRSAITRSLRALEAGLRPLRPGTSAPRR